jgi:hypothetical protein
MQSLGPCRYHLRVARGCSEVFVGIRGRWVAVVFAGGRSFGYFVIPYADADVGSEGFARS